MVNLFSFGKKRRTVKRSTTKRPPAALRKLAKKYRVKISLKRGSRRVYKKVNIIKKEIKSKMKKMRKSIRKTRRKSHRFSFGLSGSTFEQPKNYGYHQKVEQYPGTLSQSGSYVTKSNNINRPPGMGLSSNEIPTRGTYARFFTENVPRVIGPNGTGFMGQPDGSLYAVGGPFYRYTDIPNTDRKKYTNDTSVKPVTQSQPIKRNTITAKKTVTRSQPIKRTNITGRKPVTRVTKPRKTMFGFF